MGERRGTKALELWCRRVTEGYPGVEVSNMTTAWRDGLAFCALIHRFRPDLIDFASLRPNQALQNNELAFQVAERHLGIPALLDAEDMVDSSSPDRLSVLTYLAQFYQTFGQASLAMGIISPGRNSALKSSPEGNTEPKSPPPCEETTPQAKKVWRVQREPCASCNLPVFLAERLACSGRTFHRTCFKCARCGAQLSPANCYETENHAFCCEVCPDEELPAPQTVIPPESSSDNEEDSVSVGGSCDEYSANLETVLEAPGTPPLANPALSAFLTSQLEPAVTIPQDLPMISPSNLAQNSILDQKLNGSMNSFDCKDIKSSDLTLCDSKNAQTFLVNKNNSEVSDNSVCSISVDLEKPSIRDPSASSSRRSSDTSSLVSNRRSMFENLIQKEESIVKDVASRKSSSSSISARENATDNAVSMNESVAPLSNSIEQVSEEVPELLKVDPPNPFEILEDETNLEKKQEEEKLPEIIPPSPAPRKQPPVTVILEPAQEQIYPDDLNPFGEDEETTKISKSSNPFGSSSDDEEEENVPLRKVIPIDARLNPFWEEGQEEDEEPKLPVPRPRSLRSYSPEVRPSPAPRRNTATLGPSTPSPSKKKTAAPPPPSPALNSPAISPHSSLRPARKSRPAPRPPGQPAKSPEVEKLMQMGEKGIKDELNRTRQGLVAAERLAPEKSREGQWKRKKGPAPALPIPPRRQVYSTVPMSEVRQELELIEVQQRGLEKQGVRLEEQIREQIVQLGCDDDTSLPPELEDTVLQLFELVNEKNELFRRQAELMYFKRQQRLEEQQADLEWQIRCLLQQRDRGEEEIKKEEELIARLVEVVEQRNQIVDCLEMDRKREADEDQSVRERLQMLSHDRQSQPLPEEIQSKGKGGKSKKSKLRLISKDKSKVKEKKKEEKKSKKEKPVSPEPQTSESSSKKQSKKKWFS